MGRPLSPSLDPIDAMREEFLVAMETELTFTQHGYSSAIELDDGAMLQVKQVQ